jgi:prepilin peptidase CpaA
MTTLGFVSQLAILGFIVLLSAAAFSDIRKLTIPNSYCLGIALCYPFFALAPAQPVDWLGGLMVGGGLLVVGFILFTTGRFGGGDAKLMAATSLWAGPSLIVDFILLTALTGGCLALLLYVRHRWLRSPSLAAMAATEASPDFAQQPMPYGVAIFAGGVYVAFTLLGLV